MADLDREKVLEWMIANDSNDFEIVWDNWNTLLNKITDGEFDVKEGLK